MRVERATDDDKGWLAGPWESGLGISIVARDISSLRVESDTIELAAGDVLIVDPGEGHTVLASSPDYLHFVVHVPGPTGDEARCEKQLVPRCRLGL